PPTATTTRPSPTPPASPAAARPPPRPGGPRTAKTHDFLGALVPTLIKWCARVDSNHHGPSGPQGVQGSRSPARRQRSGDGCQRVAFEARGRGTARAPRTGRGGVK